MSRSQKVAANYIRKKAINQRVKTLARELKELLREHKLRPFVIEELPIEEVGKHPYDGAVYIEWRYKGKMLHFVARYNKRRNKFEITEANTPIFKVEPELRSRVFLMDADQVKTLVLDIVDGLSPSKPTKEV